MNFQPVLLLVSSLLSHAVVEQPDKLDEAIRKKMAELHVAGTSVAVLRNGKVVLMKGYGLANVEQSIPATPETKYQIASTTKPFTAMAIMMLVEGGKISLDEKAAKYLPKLPARYSEVTIRQLLTQTSGVNRDLRTGNTDDFTVEEFWKRLATAPASFTPGERWEYSNTGYILLGMIIESVSGKTYGEFLRERVLRPLGMKNTTYLEPLGKSKDRAIGYDWVEDTFRPSPYFSGGFSAGGLLSTVSDMAKWDAALNTEKLMKRKTLEQMFTPARLGNGSPVNFDFRGEPSSYGFGWFLTSYRGRKIATHGGVISGFSSQIMRFTDSKITIIVNSNGKSGADRIGYAEVLAKTVADAYTAEPDDTNPKRLPAQRLDARLPLRGDVLGEGGDRTFRDLPKSRFKAAALGEEHGASSAWNRAGRPLPAGWEGRLGEGRGEGSERRLTPVPPLGFNTSRQRSLFDTQAF